MSRIITVSSAAQLTLAVRRSLAGDTILVAPGHYGAAVFNGALPNGLVTIRPLSPDGGVEFSQLRIVNSRNLLLEGFTIHNPLAPGQTQGNAMQITKSSGITLSGFDIHGSLDGNPHNDGHGLSVVESQGVMILDSRFRELNAAMVISRSSDVVVAGNHVTQVREGVNMSEIRNGLFDRNFLADFDPMPADHPDFFQVHTTRNGASHNLVFRNNVMIQTDGDSIGGIFIRSERVADGIRHSDITIENNFYEGTYRNAIMVTDADRVVIRQNTLLESAWEAATTAIVVGNLNTAIIERNIAPLILHRSDSTSNRLIIRNNVDVIDSRFGGEVAAADLFDREFGDTSLASMTPRAGSLADQRGAGARLSGEIGGFSASTADLVQHYGAAMGFDPLLPPLQMV